MNVWGFSGFLNPDGRLAKRQAKCQVVGVRSISSVFPVLRRLPARVSLANAKGGRCRRCIVIITIVIIVIIIAIIIILIIRRRIKLPWRAEG